MGSVQDRCLQSVMGMLPNVTHFEVNFPPHLDKVLDFLWTSPWARLENVSCQVHVSQCVKNLDDSFLGAKLPDHIKSSSSFPGMRKFSVTFFHSKQVCQALTSPETV
ncbi:unnamed protein product, partial [Allacma fusca]